MNSSQADKNWKELLQSKLSALESVDPDQIGLYVKKIQTREEFSWNGEKSWYLASGVKIPIALEVLKQVESGKLSLDTQIKISKSDYVDGAGETNYKKVGSLVSLRFLFEQMLINSDNTASDLLIRQVGLKKVNENLKSWVPIGFSSITTLADVRRHAYGVVHPLALKLKNEDMMLLKTHRKENEKLAALAKLIGVDQEEFKTKKLRDAFQAYYEGGLNSGTLEAYGKMLELLIEGKHLKETSTQYLLETLAKVKTGKRRIKAGLPKGFVFAHKTGTQYRRICDLGIAWNEEGSKKDKVIITACLKGMASLKAAERTMGKLGEAIYSSGVFSR